MDFLLGRLSGAAAANDTTPSAAAKPFASGIISFVLFERAVTIANRQ